MRKKGERAYLGVTELFPRCVTLATPPAVFAITTPSFGFSPPRMRYTGAIVGFDIIIWIASL